MKPLIAIVGRPNVGKSTLFNRLVGERRAIVLDTPGVTRDRNYGEFSWRDRDFRVVDTGGFELEAKQGLPVDMREQALIAVEEAEIVLFIVDGREGLSASDEEVARLLRGRAQKVFFAVNKLDGRSQEPLIADFYLLGGDRVFGISAEHGRGLSRLLDAIHEACESLPKNAADEDFDEDSELTRVAIVGRPNVGKSTLANRLLAHERMIVSDVAGTTRDAVDLPLELPDGRRYLLIDTAGLRRKSRIEQATSEAYSVMRTINAIERSHVIVMLLDATEGITDQDARVLGLALDRGRAAVLLVNKWDAIEKDSKTAARFQQQIELKLSFANFLPTLMGSAKTGQRIHQLMDLVDKARAAHRLRIPTGPLNRWLQQTIERHHPPVVSGRPLKFTYATQVRVGPPTIVFSCNDPQGVHFSYERYLMNQFREAFEVEGTPIRFQYKGKKNPYVEG